jgi:S1-C subfamily serine protease
MVFRKVLITATVITALAACGEAPKTDTASTSQDSAATTTTASSSLQDAQLKPEDIRELAAKSTVSIECKVPGIAVSTGSGFFVDKGILVTNAHVIEGEDLEHCKITLSPSKSLQQLYGPSRILAIDKVNDLALVEVHNKTLSGIDDKLADVQPLTLASTTYEPRVGQPVYVLGAPMGLESTFTDGKISAFRKLDDLKPDQALHAPAIGDPDVIQMSVPISHGSSGSALLNDTGKVIGVCSSGVDEMNAQNLNFAVSLHHLRSLLNSIGKTL